MCTIFSLIPDLDNYLSNSRRKPALNKCFHRVSQKLCGRGVELASLTRNSSESRAQVSNVIPTYLLKLSLNSLIR